MKVELVTTLEGSHSLFVASLDEQYHSKHGAIQEAEHVFINAGLKHQAQYLSTINILEVGFGTGLNALLTLQFAIDNNIKINYSTIETFPLSLEIVKKLNFPNFMNDKELAKSYFNKLHSFSWNRVHQLNSNFSFIKHHTSLQDIQLQQNYHLIYYDAFAPSAQPELWTTTIFQKLYNCLDNNGYIVTYCAKGQVKRDFIQVGFQLETLAGPKGKREMIRLKK